MGRLWLLRPGRPTGDQGVETEDVSRLLVVPVLVPSKEEGPGENIPQGRHGTVVGVAEEGNGPGGVGTDRKSRVQDRVHLRPRTKVHQNGWGRDTEAAPRSSHHSTWDPRKGPGDQNETGRGVASCGRVHPRASGHTGDGGKGRGKQENQTRTDEPSPRPNRDGYSKEVYLRDVVQVPSPPGPETRYRLLDLKTDNQRMSTSCKYNMDGIHSPTLPTPVVIPHDLGLPRISVLPKGLLLR